MKDKNSWGLLQVSDWSLGSDFAPVDLKHHLLQSSYSCSITLRGDVIHLSCCTPRVTPELVSLSLQILLSAAGLWWMFCAVNWSLSLFLSSPPSVPSSSPPLTSSLSISFWRWRSRSPVWLLSFWRRRRRPRTTASSPLAPPFCLCVSVIPPVKAAMAAGWVCPTVWTPSLFLSFLVFLFLPPPSPRHLWPQAWPPLSPTPNSTLTGMAKGNISFFDTPLDSDRKVGPNCYEVMSLLASSPSQPAWTTTAWEREPKDCFCFFNDVCF